jgi:cell division septum initiation protein DivIVA
VQTQAAEAAAEALIADARNKADEIHTKARDEHARLTKEAAEAGENLRSAVAAEADELLDDARREASRIRSDAEAESGDLQAQAELAAQRTEKAAQTRADLLHEAVVADADRLATDARERADRIGSLAAEEAERVVNAAKHESEQLLDEARTAADKGRAIVDKANADAAHIVGEAKGLRARTLASADREAKSIREAARAETEKKEKRDDALDTWSARAVIVGAVGLTASGEYELARMVGFDARVAWLLPLVIDVYVVQAFRRHRDILQAIALTIAANVVFHLADKGLFGVEKVKAGHEPQWWLIALVASVASLILWRMHLITRPQGAAAPVVEAPVEPPVGARDERVERPKEAPKKAPGERAQQRPPERPKTPKSERPPERRERAQPKAKKGAQKPLGERRHERVEALYAELGKRPEWTDIRDALAAEKLADKSISRSSCQRIRDAVEADKPHLVATGSANVRPITGS